MRNTNQNTMNLQPGSHRFNELSNMGSDIDQLDAVHLRSSQVPAHKRASIASPTEETHTRRLGVSSPPENTGRCGMDKIKIHQPNISTNMDLSPPRNTSDPATTAAAMRVVLFNNTVANQEKVNDEKLVIVDDPSEDTKE